MWSEWASFIVKFFNISNSFWFSLFFMFHTRNYLSFDELTNISSLFKAENDVTISKWGYLNAG